MKSTDKKVSRNTFVVMPLVVLLIAPGLHDANGLPKLIALVVGTYFAYVLNRKKFYFGSLIQILPWSMVISYVIIQIIRKDDFQHFLLGGFFRNGGLIALISFAIIFSITSNLSYGDFSNFTKLFLLTSYLLIIFGDLEFLNLLPFKISSSYQGSISLTLTNPNFASAFLGTFISVFVISKLLDRKIINLQNIFVILNAGFLLYKTQSLQGSVVVATGAFVTIIAYREEINKYLLKYKKISFSFFLIISSIILLNLSTLARWIIANGSVRQRLSYWELSLNIFKDHFFTGVGLENLRDYATIYRNLNLVKQEGIFTAPDRSHNVVLDHFVNGGLITGSIWLLFVSSISFIALQNLKKQKDNESRKNYLILIIIWFSYLVQSLISVDHLALTLLGYISGGFIIGINKAHENFRVFPRFNKFKVVEKFPFILLSIFVLFFLSYSRQLVQYEYYAYQFLYKNDASVLGKFYDSKAVVPQTLEDVTVKISQTKDFATANKFALKLLVHRPNSHQGYYIKSVYYESLGNLSEARDEMLKALKIDKYNSVYLLGMSIFEFKLGNKTSAGEYLQRTIEINPNQQGLEIVTKLLNS